MLFVITSYECLSASAFVFSYRVYGATLQHWRLVLCWVMRCWRRRWQRSSPWWRIWSEKQRRDWRTDWVKLGRSAPGSQAIMTIASGVWVPMVYVKLFSRLIRDLCAPQRATPKQWKLKVFCVVIFSNHLRRDQCMSKKGISQHPLDYHSISEGSVLCYYRALMVSTYFVMSRLCWMWGGIAAPGCVWILQVCNYILLPRTWRIQSKPVYEMYGYWSAPCFSSCMLWLLLKNLVL